MRSSQKGKAGHKARPAPSCPCGNPVRQVLYTIVVIIAYQLHLYNMETFLLCRLLPQKAGLSRPQKRGTGRLAKRRAAVS